MDFRAKCIQDFYFHSKGKKYSIKEGEIFEGVYYVVWEYKWGFAIEIDGLFHTLSEEFFNMMFELI